MDDICPDTYCGGDIIFYTQGMSCRGNSCTISLSGCGHSAFDKTALEAAENTSTTTSEHKNIVINYGSMSVGATDLDGYQATSFEFSCTLNDLPMNIQSYDKKQDLVYDLVVWGCIRELEETAFNY